MKLSCQFEAFQCEQMPIPRKNLPQLPNEKWLPAHRRGMQRLRVTIRLLAVLRATVIRPHRISPAVARNDGAAAGSQFAGARARCSRGVNELRNCPPSRVPPWFQSIEPLSLRTHVVMDLTDDLSAPKNTVMCSTHCALRFISPLGLTRLMGGIRLF
jgi:hypothetical protein